MHLRVLGKQPRQLHSFHEAAAGEAAQPALGRGPAGCYAAAPSLRLCAAPPALGRGPAGDVCASFLLGQELLGSRLFMNFSRHFFPSRKTHFPPFLQRLARGTKCGIILSPLSESTRPGLRVFAFQPNFRLPSDRLTFDFLPADVGFCLSLQGFLLPSPTSPFTHYSFPHGQGRPEKPGQGLHKALRLCSII